MLEPPSRVIPQAIEPHLEEDQMIGEELYVQMDRDPEEIRGEMNHVDEPQEVKVHPDHQHRLTDVHPRVRLDYLVGQDKKENEVQIHNIQ